MVVRNINQVMEVVQVSEVYYLVIPPPLYLAWGQQLSTHRELPCMRAPCAPPTRHTVALPVVIYLRPHVSRELGLRAFGVRPPDPVVRPLTRPPGMTRRRYRQDRQDQRKGRALQGPRLPAFDLGPQDSSFL